MVEDAWVVDVSRGGLDAIVTCVGWVQGSFWNVEGVGCSEGAARFVL